MKDDRTKILQDYNKLLRDYNRLQDDFNFAEEDREALLSITADDLADLSEEHIRFPDVSECFYTF